MPAPISAHPMKIASRTFRPLLLFRSEKVPTPSWSATAATHKDVVSHTDLIPANGR